MKAQIDWETWVYGPGLAPVHLDFTTKGLNDSLALVDSYIAMPADFNHTAATDLWKNEFVSTTKTIFTQKLNTEFSKCGTTCITKELFASIDADMDITHEINPDVKQEWQPLGIMLGLNTTVELAHTTVSTVGRMKYLSPVYDALLKTTEPV